MRCRERRSRRRGRPGGGHESAWIPIRRAPDRTAPRRARGAATVIQFTHRLTSCRSPPARARPPTAPAPAAHRAARRRGRSRRLLGPMSLEPVRQPGSQHDQPPHQLQRHRAGRAQEPVRSNLREPRRQHVLQEPAEELHRIERHLPPPLRSYTAIRKGHPAIVDGDDPKVADGHPEGIRCQVPQRIPDVVGRPTVHDPILVPDRRVNPSSKPSRVS